MSIHQFVALPILLFAFANSAHAVVIANSAFDSDSDGWTWNPVQNPAFSWQSTGGNPGGYIRADDNLDQGGGMSIFAPAPFLGDWLALGVSELSFQSNIFTTGSVFQTGNLIANIVGPGGDATWTGPQPDPATTWKQISAPITASDWTVNTGTWDAILADVTELNIAMEYYNNFTPFEITGIDNISLSSVPIPATALLFGSGLLGLIGIARRKNA